MGNSSKNDFLRFNAYSIKELITRKLSQSGEFTDQIYEGSNLATLIDMVSYMYQCLAYQLNTAAAESMFSDTQLYENIIRLCNFIGYHPKAFKPSTIDVYLTNSDTTMRKTIYPCTSFDTGLKDSRGNEIYFSTPCEDPLEYEKTEYTTFQMINGVWKKYPVELTASGTDYETFELNIQSDSEMQKYVANESIKVFVQDADGNIDKDWYYDPNELFIQSFTQIDSSQEIELSRIYNNYDKVYSIRLNENKKFEIKVGNGIVGQKLKAGDKLIILYLDSNGTDGDIDVKSIDMASTKFMQFGQQNGLDEETYRKLFDYDPDKSLGAETDQGGKRDLQNYIRDNGYVSLGGYSSSAKEESVEDIRNNAPSWFKSGNRLITKSDYEYYFKANTKGSYGNVVDVKCMNNWEYMTTYYRWLYNLGVNPISYAITPSRVSSPYRYLEKSRLVNNGFKYVDSADANNVYLWMEYENEKNFDVLKNSINKSIQNIKTMTTEIYPMRPIDVYFDISFTPDELYYEKLTETDSSQFDFDYSYLEITMTDNSIYSNNTIQNNVVDIITGFFDKSNCTLGQNVNFDKLLNQIYEINGVERIRTVFYPQTEEYSEDGEILKSRHCDGISFASWSNTEMIDRGDDLQINNTSRKLEDFQFPRLAPATLASLKDKIRVIKKTMNTTNPVKF